MELKIKGLTLPEGYYILTYKKYESMGQVVLTIQKRTK